MTGFSCASKPADTPGALGKGMFVPHAVTGFLLAAMLSASPALARGHPPQWHGFRPGPGGGIVLASGPPHVITDSIAYCHQLAGEVAAERRIASRPRPPAARMAAEGISLCRRGYVRPGIMRLRRAWVLFRSTR